MKLLVYTRHELVDRTLWAGDPALLLEGSWPSGASADCRSLDDAIDGRFRWIDRWAAQWAEQLAETAPPQRISSAYLNALDLRYYLVKLLRPVAYLTHVQPLRSGDSLELTAAAGRDEDYVDVLAQYCRSAGVSFQARWTKGPRRRPDRLPRNALWRRWLARLSRHLQAGSVPSDSGRRVVLCGNPRLLDPVCRQLLARRSHVWWLYDRFAVGSWLRWQAAGVGQLVCDSSLGGENRLWHDARMLKQLELRGVSLAASVGRWLAEREATHGPRQTRLCRQIDAHFRQVRPEVLVLDEDATPMARAAVAAARPHGAASLVVQHGVPCCRFGFAPPAADRVLVWGLSSARQLTEWGVPAERISVAGIPQHDGLRGEIPAPWEARPPRILLLTTVPPRDHRPDAVALHLTARTYAEMLRTAFATVAGIDGAELIVKLHPRADRDPIVRALRSEFRSIRCRVVRRGTLEPWLRGIDCVLSCGSSAGVEATLAGLPVIQLAPPRGYFPAHDQWGLAGTAHGEIELQKLLARVLVEGWRPPAVADPEVFAAVGEPAAARIAQIATRGPASQPTRPRLQPAGI